MNVNEAREVLGVDASVVGQDLKRAYLRKVKAHPPDREPQQFDRVRRAYELLSAPSWQQVIEAEPLEPEADVVEDIVADDLDSGEWSGVEFVPGPQTEALSKLTETLKQEGLLFDTLLAQLSAINVEETEAACRLIVNYLWRHERGYLVEDFIATAAQRGVGGLERIVVHYCPQQLSGTQLWSFMEEPLYAFAAERELARRGDERLVARYEVHLNEAFRHGHSFDVSRILRLVLGLQAAGKVTVADSLLARLNHGIEVIGSGHGLPSSVALQLQAAKELSDMPNEAAEFRSIVVDALLASDPTVAEKRLELFARSQPKVAKRLRALLEQGHPVLSQLFVVSRSTNPGLRWYEWVGPIIAIGVLRVLWQSWNQRGGNSAQIYLTALLLGPLAFVSGAHAISNVVRRWRMRRSRRQKS